MGSSENIDYGDIVDNVEPERDENFFFVNDWGLITATADVLPFGPINVVDGRDALGRSRSQWIPENANTVLFDVNDTALEKAVTPWIGSGTIQEIGSGLERIVIPDLGAAGAVIFIPSGTAEESISRGNYDGAGAIAKSGLSATDLDQVYPYVGSGDITLSGTTTTPYNEAYLPVIKNAFRVKGGDNRLFDVEKVIYNYARSVSDVFEKEDNGTITVREGASFDNLNVTFDEVITDPLAKERSFSDEDQVEFESYGNILDTPTSAEDYGVLEQQLQGGIFFDEYQATFVKGNDAIVRGYEGLGTFKKEGAADEDRFFAYSGSGTATFSGENFFSQAPQSTIFGVGDKITASGSADEAFVPATVDNTVLFGISGDGAESRNILPTTRKALLRPSGSVSGIAIVTGSGDKSNTVLFNTSGAATDVVLVKDYENTNLFDISGGMQQGVPVYTPSWFSATGESATEEYDWGLITATPTQLSEDWGPINTNDETIPKVAENWGFLLGEFNYVQVGGQHYPNRDTFSVGESSLIVQTAGTTGVATFLLSEDLDIAAAIQYESSGITGIATYKAGINIFGANWFSQAPQHTVFGEEGAITIGISTANESITPFIPEGSGSLFTIGGAAESSTKAYLVGDYQFISGAANVNFAPHITGVGTGTFSQGREPYQTYARKINIPDDEFGGTISLTGNTIFEKNTDSYNESSILFGTENEDYGSISVEDVGRGFSLSSLGIGLTSVESLDAGDITFDNSQQTGLTYDEAVGGPGVLPSFDKNQQYNVRFDSNVVAEDRGILGISSVGGRPYTRLYPSDTGFDQQEINNGYEDAGFITDPAPRESQFPFGKIVFPTIPAKFTQFIPSWIGSGTLNVSGTSIERVAVASSTTSLFDFVSGADERFIAQTPEGTVLFDISGTANESVTKDFVGSGSITLESGVGITTYRRILDIKGVGSATFSGSGVIRSSFDPPEGTYLHIFGDGYSDFKVSFATQSQKATLRLVGELTHPDIDFTPHYGIDRNIGIETGMFLLPGGGLNEDGTGPGIVTTRFLPKYPATGRITIDGKAIGRTNAPILTDGTIYILGIGTEGNGQIGDDGIGDLNGVEFGAKERFVPATEFGAGSLLFDFQTTGAEARPVKVFGYYGDDKDPGTSGQITIRQEGGILTIERTVVPEIGSGTFTYSGAGQGEATTSVEIGSGSLFAIGGIAESTTAAELVAGTSIFNGTAEESFSAQTPEDTATITLSGTGVAQRRFEPVGSGTLTLSNDQRVVTGIILSPTGSGTFSILGGAAEATVEPSAARAILTDITGVAETRYFQVFQDFVPSGTFTLSGELTHPDIDFTPAYTGSGITTISGSADEVDLVREIGVGIATFSGAAVVRITADDLEGTVLFDTKGASALTALNQVYGYYGDDRDPGTSGITTISGVGITKPIQVFGYYGDDKDPGTSGGFTFSNTPLVHPFVDYTPSIGIGVAVLYQTSGTAVESFTFANYETQGRFKGLAGSKESLARATYVGIGQINTFGAGQTEYAVIEEGRTYVVII
ncbi:hypothetical protein SSSM7_110 [Synechococcus phage S-SSM7]|uniref:Uncharacterized protein n=1 Tax=Synechococcus phage S-SSM7 TaxID=445686 RepID=E3SL28_9CAUD|nr:hypothetical protein SSSM7_110 [Synechococcus phage S-SSM7]ADO98176.1 hypothetical protein SSSM7_110 [Synechococcus phage S-SSM7]